MPSKYTKEKLEPIIKVSKSWSEVCRRLGVTPYTGAQTYITKVAKKLEISHDHFTGKAWNRGNVYPVKDITKHLVLGSNIASSKLRSRLIKAGLKEQRCEICKLTEWLGKDIVLELDHINSNHTDNRLENLQILCSNCHADVTRERRKHRAHGETGKHVVLRKLC